MRDRHMVPGKENIGNLVFCQMASSVMTSGDLDCQTASSLYYSVGSYFLRKYATNLRRFPHLVLVGLLAYWLANLLVDGVA